MIYRILVLSGVIAQVIAGWRESHKPVIPTFSNYKESV